MNVRPVLVVALISTILSSIGIADPIAIPRPQALMPYPRIPGFEGHIEFTDREKAMHAKKISILVEAAGKCLQTHIDRQNNFWEQYKVSAYYGYDSDWNNPLKTTQQDKENLFTRMNVPLSLISQLEPISCVNMTLKCVEAGFSAAGQLDIWAKIKAFTLANGQDGTALQLALQRLGWKVLYWNPSPEKVQEWDKDDLERDAKIRQGNEPVDQFHFFGRHEERLAGVEKNKMYLFNPVDDAETLVGYGTKIPAKFTRIPFFVGTAHGGFHVFPGKFGKVIEAHNHTRITNKRTVEAGPFDPLGQLPTQNHRPEFHPDAGAYGIYRSGIIAVPPGFGL